MLRIEDLTVNFTTLRGYVKALENVSLEIGEREVMALVGETGSGKTTIGLAAMRLLPPNAIVKSGRILFNGTDLLKLSDEEMRKIRGRKISMIFQEPRISLNPVLTIGRQLMEIPEEHLNATKKEAYEMSVEALRKVGLADPERIMKSYPHELSGGMAQRVMIAMAMMLKPKLLVADEPTSALDVTVQAQVIDLMKKLVRDTGSSVLFITHDLSLAAEFADNVTVIYRGRIVEKGDIYSIFYEPKHPYTKSLLEAIPKIGCRKRLRPTLDSEGWQE